VPARESQKLIQTPRPESEPCAVSQGRDALTRVTVNIRLEAPKWRAAGGAPPAPRGGTALGRVAGVSGTGAGTVTGSETGGFGGSTGSFGCGTETVGAVTGGGGGSGTVGTDTDTVGTLTVGGGGSWPRLVPAQAPSSTRTSAEGSSTGTDRFRIRCCNEDRRPLVSPAPAARNNRVVAHDLYEALGVARDADAETIKQAYRALARELHPDVSSAEDDGRRFREVTEAYAVLSDERSRGLYDRLGWQGRGGGIAPRRGIGRVYASNPRAFLEDLESVIASALGRRPSKEPTRVVGEVELDAYEAHVGATRRLELGGSEPCPACEGEGRRKVVSHLETGRFLSLETCASCGGTGEVATGRPLTVTVPPGSRDLDRIPVALEAVAIVRIVPPRDKVAIRVAAAVALLAAIGFLLFLLAL
jgi:hypothetical protein